ncbi:putative DMT superfamily transporter inner membrane protein [Gemmata obscuriglobus]|uniref:EamA/RhaT family transporter n=1 Tax=Gemmata obscuriglobus TaxID=114 RepID=A0A2Z3H6F6_9BACT|nr:DMT family transporter [Gemmata obscuriglobus]AWM39156.1 EamA/RhaT family transporter [Gemmata obscuriglobus]QEG27798.1 putative DMT superfamily transporter inner membrane protein [Gemmata obscuriglobus]VTS05122.1 membrane protein : Membrane protein OS=Delftia tsuruhatensis GN=GY14_21530 PE=4 SV=1: EamA: EamA [Gemmata obscuriglobus UQM 2246]
MAVGTRCISGALFCHRHELALVVITIIWGATFTIIHEAMKHCGPLFFVGVRYLTGGALALLLFRNSLKGLTARELVAGVAIGVSIVFGLGFLGAGLKTISSSRSAFITALYVPMVPLLQWLVLRRLPRLMSWIGIGLAFTGLMFVAGPGTGEQALGCGELYTLLGAFAIAAQIILIGRFAAEVDSRRVTVVQLLVAGGLATLATPLAGEELPTVSWGWLVSALGLGVASVLIQLAMNWAQKNVSPTRATVIYAAEPVWGGLFGYAAGDRLPPLGILGGVFIVAGVLVSELKPRKRERNQVG